MTTTTKHETEKMNLHSTIVKRFIANGHHLLHRLGHLPPTGTTEQLEKSTQNWCDSSSE